MVDKKNTTVSIIVPTYHEVENIPELIKQIDGARVANNLSLELLIMDDNSQDGSVERVNSLNLPWVRIVVRTKDKGLSAAVLDGLRLAKNDILVVMDADLSHPPEKIPEMIKKINEGHDFVIGSRYVNGASTDIGWGVFRWLNSKVATLLARPLTSVKDPMSGFFALPRAVFEGADKLNPIGYKIGLELIVKCHCKNTAEVPIHFADRKFGQSKLSLKEQLNYIKHVRWLFIYKYEDLACLLQFGFVGLLGVLVNLAVLTLLLNVNIPAHFAVAVAIAVSIGTNFLLNRRFTFSYARRECPKKQFVGFVTSSSLAAVVNYLVTIGVMTIWFKGICPQLAALVGILAGTIINFFANRYVVFKKK